MKRTISFILSIIMLISVTSGLTVSAEETLKYPYNLKYKFGADVSNIDSSVIQKKYKEWVNVYVTSSGCPVGRRVRSWGKNPNVEGENHWYTCSEGIGYGMLLAAYFNDQVLLDDLWTYARHYVVPKTGLMRYYINEDMTFDRTAGNATDGDIDMAMALVLADKLWGSSEKYNYKEEATRTINNIYKWCIEEGTYVVNGGAWGGSNCTDPSYYGIAWFKTFADYTNNSGWNKVVDACYRVIANVNKYNNGTGLLPDFCSADGTPPKDTKTYEGAYRVEGDAFRAWWRIATDAAWNGDTRAINQCSLIASYFNKKKKTYGDNFFNNIGRSFAITGESKGSATPLIVSMAGCLFTGCADAAGAKFYYDYTSKFAPLDYYSDAINLLGMMFMSGNMPDLYKLIKTEDESVDNGNSNNNTNDSSNNTNSDNNTNTNTNNGAQSGSNAGTVTDPVENVAPGENTGNVENITEDKGESQSNVKKTVKLTSVKPGKLTTKTVKITGKTTAKATVTLKFGSKKIKSVKANKKGEFTLKKLKLKKYKGKKLILVASKSGMNSKTKKFAKIKK